MKPPPPLSVARICHTRRVSLSIFENERSTTPVKSGTQPWEYMVDLHSQHTIREEKSGPMLGGYALNVGHRSDVYVSSRSIIQLDIDSKGEKDGGTGRLLKVTRSAPSIDVTGPLIGDFEWIANSTHWHEPGIGAIKYRISILPDRDILPDEHKPVLEALDEQLGGCLDRDAWPLSQAFYAPSCPAHAAQDAFIAHNTGRPLPVDVFVARGRQILAAREQLSAQSVANASPQPVRIPETPENIRIVEGMLAAIPASGDRGPWRDVVWSTAC